MTEADIVRVVASGESDTAEFKKTTGEKDAGLRTLCGMLNGSGGRVLFGVTPSGKILGRKKRTNPNSSEPRPSGSGPTSRTKSGALPSVRRSAGGSLGHSLTVVARWQPCIGAHVAKPPRTRPTRRDHTCGNAIRRVDSGGTVAPLLHELHPDPQAVFVPVRNHVRYMPRARYAKARPTMSVAKTNCVSISPLR